MAKAVEVTQNIVEAMQRAFGQQVNPADYTVFEATAVNNSPLNKRGTLFEGAVITRGALMEMADLLNSDSVPVIYNHNSYGNDEVMPVGQVFMGRVVEDDDKEYAELRVLFAIANSENDPKRTTLVNDLNKGVINEVSIGALFKRAISSETGFDFFGPDASMLDILNREDDEGNVVGEGMHVILSGLDSWMELSLVQRGAARRARIAVKEDQVFSEDRRQRLAASGIPTEAVILTASFSDGQSKRSDDMSDIKEFTASLTALSGDLATAKVELTAAKAKNTELEASLAAKTEALEAAQAELAALKEASEQEPEAVKAARDLVISAVKAVRAAAGNDEEVAEDAKLADLVDEIKEQGVKLHQAVGAGEDGKTIAAGATDINEGKEPSVRDLILKANREA